MSVMNSQYSNLLSTLYPVGSIYIGTQNSCPLSTLIAGSQWQIVATQVVTNVNTGVEVYGNGRALGISAGSGNVTYMYADGSARILSSRLERPQNVGAQYGAGGSAKNTLVGVVQDANNSGLSGSLSRNNLALNIWKRTA